MSGNTPQVRWYLSPCVVLFCLLAPAMLCAQQLSYQQLVVQATGTFARQDYQTALTQTSQLLDKFPQGDFRELTLFDYAQCCLKLNKLSDATSAFEELQLNYPQSPFTGEALPQLYELDVANHAERKAEAIWNTACTQWAETPTMWKVITAYHQYLAQQAPQRVLVRADFLAYLHFDVNTFLAAVYRPLMDAGRFAEAKVLHEHLQQVMMQKRLPLADVEQQAYDQGLSNESIDAVFTRFKEALDAKDLVTAQKWLTVLNDTAPEHPHAVEARQLFKATQP